MGLKNGATEEELPIYPMQRWVKLNNTKNTFAVLTQGPCEYMIYNNKEIALTLFRSVGKLGKADLLIRPGRSSGYRLDAPSSQLIQKLELEYSLYLGNEENISELTRKANILRVPVPSRQLNIFTREKHEDKPWETSIMEIGEEVEIIAFKVAESKDGYVIRLLNPSNTKLNDIKIKTKFLGNKAYLSTLKEEPKEELPMKDGTIIIPEIKDRSFVTILIC